MNAKANQDEFSWFWTDLDDDITQSLTDEQKLALTTAARKSAVKKRPADIRFSIFGFFLVLICGRERRDGKRIKSEANERPVITLDNLPVLIGIWAAMIYTTWGILGYVTNLVFGT